jgi:hypothetical protein
MCVSVQTSVRDLCRRCIIWPCGRKRRRPGESSISILRFSRNPVLPLTPCTVDLDGSYTHSLFLNKMSISNFDPAFPPLHKAVFHGDDAAVTVLIANPPPKGLQLEILGKFNYYDVVTVCTILGTAVTYFSSVATIDALLKAGANPRAHISIDDRWKTPLQNLRETRENALRSGSIEEFGKWWLEFCDRAPTAEWFDQVEALLVAAEETRVVQLVAA